MIFEEKIVFSKRKTQKIRACGAATLPATPNFFAPAARLLPKQLFKMSRCSKSNYSKILTMFKKQLFKSNYPKKWWRSKAIIQKLLSKKINNVQKQLFKKPIIQKLFMKRLLPKQFPNLHAAIALSTHQSHAQNVWKRKSAPQARKNWIQELKQAFLVTLHKNMANRRKSSKK